MYCESGPCCQGGSGVEGYTVAKNVERQPLPFFNHLCILDKNVHIQSEMVDPAADKLETEKLSGDLDITVLLWLLTFIFFFEHVECCHGN